MSAMMTGRAGLLILIVGLVARLASCRRRARPARRRLHSRDQAGLEQAVLRVPWGLAAQGRVAARYGGLHEERWRQRSGHRARRERREPDHRCRHRVARAGACLRRARALPFRPKRSPGSRHGSTRGPRALPTSYRSPTRGVTGRFNRPGVPRFLPAPHWATRQNGCGTRSTRSWPRSIANTA